MKTIRKIAEEWAGEIPDDEVIDDSYIVEFENYIEELFPNLLDIEHKYLGYIVTKSLWGRLVTDSNIWNYSSHWVITAKL